MDLNTDDWTTASEAGRLLNISHQRVNQLADDGVIDAVRPWPHVLLVGRRSIAERLAGEMPSRIVTAEARRWLLARHNTGFIENIDINTAREELLEFILERRPAWPKKRQDLWALNMTSRLRNQSDVRRRQRGVRPRSTTERNP
jgi:hypothetical protein